MRRSDAEGGDRWEEESRVWQCYCKERISSEGGWVERGERAAIGHVAYEWRRVRR